MPETRKFLDYYTSAEELGVGGFSTVRKAVNKATKQTYAVKTLDKSKNSPHSNDLALFRSEILVMAHILENIKEHPNVVRMVDVFDEPKQVNIVMELCKGGELFDRIIDKGSYTEKDAANLIRQVCTGLAAIHDIGVLHRDMKPENLLFETESDESNLKIMDFGLSHIQGSQDSMTGVFGSLDYIAPEALAFRHYCEASDVWAIGVILYILLC
eukprot:gene25875-31667_t